MLTGFGPYRDSWIAWAADEHGMAIEVYPVGTEIFPPDGPGQAEFRHNPAASPHSATHATVGVNRTVEEIQDIVRSEGWRAAKLSRGPHEVVEFWVENAVMLELMTPEMTAAYLASTPRRQPGLGTTAPRPRPPRPSLGGNAPAAVMSPKRKFGGHLIRTPRDASAFLRGRRTAFRSPRMMPASRPGVGLATEGIWLFPGQGVVLRCEGPGGWRGAGARGLVRG